MDAPQVSGRALLGLFSFAKDHGGKTAIDEVTRSLGATSRDALSRRVQALGYYPYATYIDLLRALKRRFAKPSETFYRNVGASAGERDLGTMFKVYVALASPERLIRSCTRVWASYYRNAGSMTAIAWEPSDTRLRIEGFASMDRAHCELMEGWMLATMKQIGVVVGPNARETICAGLGGPHHEFACTWRAR